MTVSPIQKPETEPQCPPGGNPLYWAKLLASGKLATSTVEHLEQKPGEFFESDEEVDEFLRLIRRQRGHEE